jgi:hypothetical protein
MPGLDPRHPCRFGRKRVEAGAMTESVELAFARATD